MCKGSYRFTETLFYYDLFFARPTAPESVRCEKFALKDQRLVF